jgi:hypothetical protein
MIDHHDVKYLKRHCDNTRHKHQLISFGGSEGSCTFINDTDIPGLTYVRSTQEEFLQIGRVACSEWNVMITKLFAEEVYVRKKRPGLSFLQLCEQHIRQLITGAGQALSQAFTFEDAQPTSIPNLKHQIVTEYTAFRKNVTEYLHHRFEQEFRELYEIAYVHRLRLSLEEAGMVYLRHEGVEETSKPRNRKLNRFVDHRHVEGGEDEVPVQVQWLMKEMFKKMKVLADMLWEMIFGKMEEGQVMGEW